jgi:hypothetical protein|nr:MAG TPA: hypothetical protein [Caudoviricetes sp.]
MAIYTILTHKITNNNSEDPRAQEITRDNVAQLCVEEGKDFVLTLLDFLLLEREKIEDITYDIYNHGSTLAETVKIYGEMQYEEGYSEGESMGALRAYDEGYADGQAERD